jgi:hypothetical protein
MKMNKFECIQLFFPTLNHIQGNLNEFDLRIILSKNKLFQGKIIFVNKLNDFNLN